jgi:hypothetical protein
MARLLIWRSEIPELPEYHLTPDEFFPLNEGDLERDFANMAYWYRETLDRAIHYPVGVDVEPRFKKPTIPLGDTVLTLRRTCNLLIRGRFRYILPGRYRTLWIFWFLAGLPILLPLVLSQTVTYRRRNLRKIQCLSVFLRQR